MPRVRPASPMPRPDSPSPSSSTSSTSTITTPSSTCTRTYTSPTSGRMERGGGCVVDAPPLRQVARLQRVDETAPPRDLARGEGMASVIVMGRENG